MTTLPRTRAAIAPIALCLLTPAALASFQYSYDDGTGSVNNGPSFVGQMLWGNYFYTSSVGGITQDTVTQVSVAFGNIAIGRTVTLCVFEDLDADGNPGNAVLRATTTGLTNLPRTNTFINYNVAPTKITSGAFFVAALMDITNTSLGSSGDRPGRLDPQTNSGRSWYFADSTINTGNLGGSAFALNMANNVIPGTWLVRATAIPSPASLAPLGLLALVSRRRR
jgi:hypothetical protein